MTEFRTGTIQSLITEHPETSGWFMGSFIKDGHFLHNNDFEVKWAEHEKGYKKANPNPEPGVKTLVVMIQGSFKIAFDSGEEYILKNQGDYLFYSDILVHTGEALEDCTFLTIRWPSNRK